MIMLPNVINWALRAQVSLRLGFQEIIGGLSDQIKLKTIVRRIEKFLHLPELGENDYKNETKSWIQIENGNFNWGDENITLKNINLEVEPNKLVAIVGSVGSGKSSLIQVLV